MSYLALMCHYITDDWTLQRSIMVYKYFQKDDTHIAKNINSETLEMMNDHGIISDDIKSSDYVFVTDNGSANTGINVTETFCERILCSNNIIRTILTNVLNKQTCQVDEVKSKPFYYI